MRTLINTLSQKDAGKKVELAGWVHEIRSLAKISFLLLRDWSGICQCIAPNGEVKEEVFSQVSELKPESVVRITGEVRASNISKKGFEVLIQEITIVQAAAPVLPIQVVDKDKSIQTDLSTRLDNRSLDLRKPENLAIFQIASSLVNGMQEFLQSRGFIQIFTPSILGASSEGGSEVFKIGYFGRDAYLRQDPQLHRELAILGGLEKIYEIGPSWRAELSRTTRHLCEHRVIAVEQAFINDEIDVIKLEQDMIVAGIKNAVKNCKAQLELLKVNLKVPTTPFPELRFPEIYDILEQLGKKLPAGEDIDTESMKLLGNYVREKFQSDFWFVNRFPSAIKPFYVMYVDDQPQFARSVDLNYMETELSSGGQREHRHSKIIQQIRERDMKPEHHEWFTKFFLYGAPSLGGFALGIERFVKVILNLENVKEAVLFPRDPDRLTP